MDAPLRDLDERVRAKEKALAAIRRRKARERYRAKKAGITPAMQQTLFGHLSSKPPTG